MRQCWIVYWFNDLRQDRTTEFVPSPVVEPSTTIDITYYAVQGNVIPSNVGLQCSSYSRYCQFWIRLSFIKLLTQGLPQLRVSERLACTRIDEASSADCTSRNGGEVTTMPLFDSIHIPKQPQSAMCCWRIHLELQDSPLAHAAE